MEGRLSGGGGCCIAKYTSIYPYHGPTTQTYHDHNIDTIMLRFRPIAPKPGTGPTTLAKNDTVLKRKNQIPENTETNKRGRKSSRVRSLDDHHKSSNGYKVTLPLLPEAPDLSPKKKINNNHKKKTNVVGHVLSMPTWLSFGSFDHTFVESTVIVEGVTDTWMDGNGLIGFTDEERKVRLDDDTCPGFISDGWNRVCWTNKAYRRIVAGEEEREVMVKIEMREKVKFPAGELFPAFTCRVKVKYGKQMLIVPCDVWRMDGGGFAWRLDINTALSLGLGR
ncbi:unnamed protein product [Amaranthus hypochondriacus]